MTYMLDTNTCIRYLNGRSPTVFQRLSELSESDVFVCSIVKMELRFGALRSNAVEKTLRQQENFLRLYKSLPFDDAAHHQAAQIRADLARAGTPIGPYDLLIAAIALANDLTLVTHNTREFSRVAGLRLVDWEAEDA
jgi:tRNA(fMet)-specific endonuclease VapC